MVVNQTTRFKMTPDEIIFYHIKSRKSYFSDSVSTCDLMVQMWQIPEQKVSTLNQNSAIKSFEKNIFF